MRMREAVLNVHPAAMENTVFGMLQCFMDESGIHDQAEFCVVAGYVGKVKDWKKFEVEWAKILRKAGVPEFHAKQFHSGQGGYRSWTAKQRQAFLEKLLIAIKRHNLFMLGSAVSVADFFSYSENDRRWLTGGRRNPSETKWIQSGAPSKPYFLPFLHAVISSAERCKPSEKVHFFFDLNRQYSGWGLELYNQMKSSVKVRENLGQLSFADSKEALGLQAADLICYDVVRMAEDLKHTPTYIVRQAGKRGTCINLFDKTGLELVLSPSRSSFPKPDPSV